MNFFCASHAFGHHAANVVPVRANGLWNARVKVPIPPFLRNGGIMVVTRLKCAVYDGVGARNMGVVLLTDTAGNPAMPSTVSLSEALPALPSLPAADGPQRKGPRAPLRSVSAHLGEEHTVDVHDTDVLTTYNALRWCTHANLLSEVVRSAEAKAAIMKSNPGERTERFACDVCGCHQWVTTELARGTNALVSFTECECADRENARASARTGSSAECVVQLLSAALAIPPLRALSLKFLNGAYGEEDFLGGDPSVTYVTLHFIQHVLSFWTAVRDNALRILTGSTSELQAHVYSGVAFDEGEAPKLHVSLTLGVAQFPMDKPSHAAEAILGNTAAPEEPGVQMSIYAVLKRCRVPYLK